MGFSGGIKLPKRGGQCQRVAERAEAADHADGLVAEIAGVAERLAGVRVGQVHFDEGDRHRRQCVADRDAGMGEGGGIDQDEVGAVGTGGLDAFDQRVLGVGLEAFQRVPGFGGACPEVGIDGVQAGMPIDLRLARAEQVEVGAVEDEQLCHRDTGRSMARSLGQAPDAVQFADDGGS